MAARTPPQLTWHDDVPSNPAFGDAYYTGGLEEVHHVFLAGNDLPGRFRDGFHIAELGFGTGLNLVAACAAFRATGVPGRLHYTGFEAHPIRPEDMARAFAAFPALAGSAAPILDWWRDPGQPLELPTLRAEVIFGEAATTLPPWTGRADAWFLDGFAPARNPGLWSQELMDAVADHTAPGGTFATYTAAGAVRRALAAAGFEVTRAPGYGRKRHMTLGRLA